MTGDMMRKASIYTRTTAPVTIKKKETKAPKRQLKRSRLNHKVANYGFGLNRITIIITSTLVIIILYTVVRFLVIDRLSSPSRFLTEVSRNACNMYVATIIYDITLFELVMWNNNMTVGYKSAYDYYFEARARLVKNIEIYKQLMLQDEGEGSRMLHEKMGLDMCTVFRNTEEKMQDYVNCTIAMGGINNQPVMRWWPMYLVLGDNLVRDWQNTKTQSDRNDLLKLDQYASMFIYSSYNLWGTGDAIYYNVMFPSITLLIQELDKIVPTVNLTDIISIIFFLVTMPFVFRYLGITLFAILTDFWEMIYAVPLNLIDTNPRLKQKLKNAYSTNKFTSFD